MCDRVLMCEPHYPLGLLFFRVIDLPGPIFPTDNIDLFFLPAVDFGLAFCLAPDFEPAFFIAPDLDPPDLRAPDFGPARFLSADLISSFFLDRGSESSLLLDASFFLDRGPAASLIPDRGRETSFFLAGRLDRPFVSAAFLSSREMFKGSPHTLTFLRSARMSFGMPTGRSTRLKSESISIWPMW